MMLIIMSPEVDMQPEIDMASEKQKMITSRATGQLHK